MTHKEEHVEVEQDGGVLIVRLAAEKSRNSLTTEMRDGLARIFSDAAADHSVRAVYLCGKGPSFCAGGDLNMLQTQAQPWTVHRRFRALGRWYLPLLRFEKPVVGGVRGYAVGGGMGLALACDLVVASETAKFMAGFFRLGAVPDLMMMYTLPRLIGLAQARNFLFTNGTFDAQRALELGLAAEVTPDDELDARGLELAHSLANGPTETMGLAKMIMGRTFETNLDDSFLMEGLGQALAMSGAEFQEGLSALVNKRKPDFVEAAAADDTKIHSKKI